MNNQEFPHKPLNNILAIDSPAHPDDAKDVKMYLNKKGYYSTPSYGLTPYPDTQLFLAIKDYQSDKNLKSDGVIKPDGETQMSMKHDSATSDYEDEPPIAEIKQQYFDKPQRMEDRSQFFKELKSVGSLTKRRKKAYMTVYDLEGGEEQDKEGSAVAGITRGTLNEILGRYPGSGISAQKHPRELTKREIAKVYEMYADFALERVGGKRTLDELPEDFDAQALLDTMVRHGVNDGALIVRVTLNKIKKPEEKNLPLGIGRLGKETYQRLHSVLKDESRRKQYYDVLSKQRALRYSGEKDRFNYFTEK